jgi:glycosyltransferase involved in cell wall biosynthesis
MNAGPWLPVPPAGYGGIENVVATLVPELRRRGHRVVLAATGDSALEVDELLAPFPSGQFARLTGPYNQVMGIAHAHMQAVAAALRARDDVDLVHDHLEVVGPAVLAALGAEAPPALHTLHWDLRKHPDFYAGIAGRGRLRFSAVGHVQLERAPANLREQALGVVPLSVDPDVYAFQPDKGDAFITLGRIFAGKGCDVAARACRERGLRLDLAGPVAGVDSPGELERRLADLEDPVRTLPDVRHWLEDVRPHVDGERVRWLGNVVGEEKVRLLGRARAALFPVRWAEPGGTAVVEALSCGTPVVAMRRGVMPFLVEHGVTGFLADDEAGFAACLDRVGEIDPAACRRVVEQRFTPAAMADGYEALYARMLSTASST